MLNYSKIPSRSINILYNQQNGHKPHPSLSKDKTKKFLKTSKHKLISNIHPDPLKQRNNIPFFKIDLSNKQGQQSVSKKSLQKCRRQLSSQKQLLLRQLERKQQKMTQLKQTYRKIQTSKEKDKEVTEKPKLSFKSKDIQSDRSTRNQHPSTRRTARSPQISLHKSQRTKLFPSRT